MYITHIYKHDLILPYLISTNKNYSKFKHFMDLAEYNKYNKTIIELIKQYEIIIIIAKSDSYLIL